MEKRLDSKNFEGWQETQRRLEETVDRAHGELRRFEHRLPPVLYHVTRREGADKILREGLSPSLRMEGDKEVVSLTDDIEFGKRVVSETQGVEKPGDLVVLQIDTARLDREFGESFLEDKIKDVLSPNLQKKLRSENSQALEEYLHEVHYEGKIPPDAISLYQEGSDPNADWHRGRRERDIMQEIAQDEG